MNKKIFVFDIDGTLSDPVHRQHWIASKPKNYRAFYSSLHLDGPHESIIWLARSFYEDGHIVVLCSGRPELDGSYDCRGQTEEWLVKHGIRFDKLYMRAALDYRPDDVVKVELLNEIRKDYGEPYLWFDDRTRVVKAIRKEGVKVLQVQDGDF